MDGTGFVHELHSLIVKSEISRSQFELHAYLLARSQMHTSKALQFSDGPTDAGDILVHIKLHDVIGFARARIGNVRGER